MAVSCSNPPSPTKALKPSPSATPEPSAFPCAGVPSNSPHPGDFPVVIDGKCVLSKDVRPDYTSKPKSERIEETSRQLSGN